MGPRLVPKSQEQNKESWLGTVLGSVGTAHTQNNRGTALTISG